MESLGDGTEMCSSTLGAEPLWEHLSSAGFPLVLGFREQQGQEDSLLWISQVAGCFAVHPKCRSLGENKPSAKKFLLLLSLSRTIKPS